MITQQDYQKNFAPHATPIELIQLLDFQNLNNNWYSGRFQLQVTRDNKDLSSYCEAKEFTDSLRIIAQSSSSGSTVFFWIYDAVKPLYEQPIVIFGDEGGYDVLFENVKDLLHYLSYNQPIYNANELGFVDGTYKDNPRIAEYAKWLKDNYNLDTITQDQSEELGTNAQKKYGVLFQDWMKQFVG